MALKGKDAHMRRLRNLRDQGEKIASRVLYVGGDMVRARAHKLISEGSVSGAGHVPSKPGEPPNRDTGVLQAHIETSQPDPLTVEVKSSAPYAAALEFGTSKMAERPYMRPARDSEEPKIQRLFEDELNKAVQRSGR